MGPGEHIGAWGPPKSLGTTKEPWDHKGPGTTMGPLHQWVLGTKGHIGAEVPIMFPGPHCGHWAPSPLWSQGPITHWGPVAPCRPPRLYVIPGLLVGWGPQWGPETLIGILSTIGPWDYKGVWRLQWGPGLQLAHAGLQWVQGCNGGQRTARGPGDHNENQRP